jgi:hypothetical protein
MRIETVYTKIQIRLKIMILDYCYYHYYHHSRSGVLKLFPCYRLAGRKIMHKGNLLKRHFNLSKRVAGLGTPLQTGSHVA